MKTTAKVLLLLSLCGAIAQAQISSFSHVIIVVQENRSPDNLFQGLCNPPYGTSSSCSTTPTNSQYNIQTKNWLDKTSSTGVTQPLSVTLEGSYDLNHSYPSFNTTCDKNAAGVCLMDGADEVTCHGNCPSHPHFKYVSNSTSVLNPYLTMATSYGWGNYFFQTNQGPSFPSHQFLFSGTSAPSAADDAIATFASENMNNDGNGVGCMGKSGQNVKLVTTAGENGTIYPCFEHETLSDLLEAAGISWKYYSPNQGTTIWSAPVAIGHICMPSLPTGGVCQGTEWTTHMSYPPSKVLTDISNCNLSAANWVIPTGQNSDHATSNDGGGPSWVASVINAIGNNPKCKNGETYWHNTAIIITWDEWGGWYDHEPPTILAGAQGDYQYGPRVPFIVVSAYTPVAYVDNKRMDFGTILRFMEHNYGIAEGALNFADERASTDLTEFFNLNQVPRVFQTIQAPLDANFFINDKRPATNPDND